MVKKILVYGLGEVGKIIAPILREHQKELDIVIEGFCDKRIPDDAESAKLNIFMPDRLNDFDFDHIVITSRKWYENIKGELIHTYNISEEKILFFNELFKGGEYYCNLCRRQVKMFLPGGEENHIFKEKKIIGGGYRENCVCPFCGSIDRNRWLQYVLETETTIFDTNSDKSDKRILHFAPEREVEKRIRENHRDYITADIVEGRGDAAEDIRALSFDDGIFDYIICNHVLEHIEEENRAFSELKRCLKEDGSIIMSVPICWEQRTFEDPGIDTPKDREQYYGQADHVRIYGNDIEQRLRSYGFEVKRVFVDEETYYKNKKLSLIPQDSIWILKKPK